MAKSKQPSAVSKTRSSSSKDAFGKKTKGENFYRDAKKVNRLKMMNGGKPVRDREGKIIQAAPFQKTEAETQPGRVQPDRRWFGVLIFHLVSGVLLDKLVASSFLVREHQSDIPDCSGTLSIQSNNEGQ